MSLVVVAIVATNDHRRERGFQIAELPVLYGVDEVEHPSADAESALAAESHFAGELVAHVGMLGVEVARARDRRRLGVEAPPRRETMRHRPEADRQTFDAIVCACLDDAHRLAVV